LFEDDDRDNVLVSRSVQIDEYDVISALNGYEAISLTRTQLPGLTLLDVKMTNLDGYEVCSSIKADAVFAIISMLFLTAPDNIA